MTKLINCNLLINKVPLVLVGYRSIKVLILKNFESFFKATFLFTFWHKFTLLLIRHYIFKNDFVKIFYYYTNKKF